MDVYDGGQWVVGGDGPIRQNADRLCAKRTLDMDLIGGDIRQVRFWDDGQLQRLGGDASASPQSAAAAAAPVPRAIRDRRVRSCSWMAAGPFGHPKR